MSIKSLEEFDRENAAKRARLEKDLALVHQLPTKGVMVRWIGENGWDNQGNPNPPTQREIDVAPWIVHAPFRGCEHIAYKAPDSLSGDKGEHVSSKFRGAFCRQYFAAVLDSFEPFMADTVALEGTYKSFQHESWDYASNRDYKDAHEVARGLYVLEVSTGRGFQSAKVELHAYLADTGPLQISIEPQGFMWYKLMARAHYSSDSPNARIERWSFPDYAKLGAVKMYRRGDGCGNAISQSYTTQFLFESREALMAVLQVPEERT